MWAIAIGAVLAVVAVVVVLLPFVRARRDADPLAPFDAEGVRVQREGLYRALETLRLERELGQVDDEEFERQMREYRRTAALLVREQERLLGEASTPDDLGSSYEELEREVQEARARLQRMEDEAP